MNLSDGNESNILVILEGVRSLSLTANQQHLFILLFRQFPPVETGKVSRRRFSKPQLHRMLRLRLKSNLTDIVDDDFSSPRLCIITTLPVLLT